MRNHNSVMARLLSRGQQRFKRVQKFVTILIAEDKHGPLFDVLHDHKRSVEIKLEEYKVNPPAWAKYVWVAGYHDWFCGHHDHYFSEEHKIDVDLFRATPSLIIE